MYGYIYKTVNLINNRMYIGKHCSENFDTTYYGSGKLLLRAIKKYGKKNFSVEVLEWCKTEEELNNREKYYIDFYKQKYGRICYNVAAGGTGGDVFAHASEEEKKLFKEKMTVINKQRCNTEKFKKRISETTKQRMSLPKEKEKKSEQFKRMWENPDYREAKIQSLKILNTNRDRTSQKIPHKTILNGEERYFESRGELRNYYKNTYGIDISHLMYHNILQATAEGRGYEPFHKNIRGILTGLQIYILPKNVTTKGDECTPVETEMETASKCKTNMEEIV